MYMDTFAGRQITDRIHFRKKKFSGRKSVKRIAALTTLLMVLAAFLVPAFALPALAEDGGFTMEVPFKLQYGREDIWTNGTGNSRHYLTMWEHGPNMFFQNDLINAGSMQVTHDSAGYHLSVDPVKIEEKTGDSELYHLNTLDLGYMSFTARDPKLITIEDGYNANFYAYNFVLDAPVRFYQKLEIYYSEDRYQGTHEYQLNIEHCTLTVMVGVRKDEVVPETGQYQFEFQGTQQYIDTDLNKNETTTIGDDYEEEPSYYIFYWEGSERPLTLSGIGAPAAVDESTQEEVTQNASETAGETGTDFSTDIVEGDEEKEEPQKDDDEGSISLPGAVAVGVGATAAGAAGAAAAASSLSGGAETAEEDKKRYRMYVGKNFGDAIRKGASPVAVTARIAEIGKGGEKSRDDLTRNISVSGTGVSIVSAALKGSVLEALVSADEASQAKEGTVTFSYAGLGGNFKNNIVFRLVGKPYLRFPEVTAGGDKWTLNADIWVDMIAGDEKTYPVLIYFEDAIGDPTVLKFGDSDDLKVSSRPADRLHTFYADIANRTLKVEGDGSAFAEIEERYVSVHAEFENGDQVDGIINIRLYPEGLVVRPDPERVEDSQMLLNAYEDDIFYGDDVAPTPRFLPTRFRVMVALSTKDGARIIDGDKAGIKMGKLIGEEGAAAGLAEKFDYELSNVGSEYTMVSKRAIVEADVPFLMKLPVSCEVEGELFEAEVPVRVLGLKPAPLQDWQMELKKVIYAIKRFVDDGEKRTYWVMILKRHMDSGNYSAYTLRMMWWGIYYEYYDFEVSVGAGYLFKAEVVDWMLSGAELTKWVCGVAFSYCADAYTGNPIAGAFVQMAYEFAMDSIEELTDAFINGRSFDYERLNSFKHIADAGNNIAGSMMTDSLVIGKPGVKMQNAKFIGMYFGFLVIKNFLDKMNESGEIDLPGAIFAALKDMTTTMFKVIAGHLFGAWIKNREFQKQATNRLAKYIARGYTTFKGDKLVKGGELAKKFLEECVGEGVGTIIEAAENKYQTSEFGVAENGDFTITFRLWESEGSDPICCRINLTKSFTFAFYGPYSPLVILYDLIFGQLTGEPAMVSFPEDPKQVRQRRMKERLQTAKLYDDQN